MKLKQKILKIHHRDNVATVLINVTAGDQFECPGGDRTLHLTALDDIPFGHKICIAHIPKGTEILKYGETIGIASRKIDMGQLVHVHNIDSLRGRGDLEGTE